jgi:hypothetical protein
MKTLLYTEIKPYKLHYASIDLEGDIPCFEFKKHAKMINFIDEKCIGRTSQCVWLIAKLKTTDIFISDSSLSIQDFIKSKHLWVIPDHYFLQEYASFEEAYHAAILINETSPMAYLTR